jgi:hypothetical protein
MIIGGAFEIGREGGVTKSYIFLEQRNRYAYTGVTKDLLRVNQF